MLASSHSVWTARFLMGKNMFKMSLTPSCQNQTTATVPRKSETRRSYIMRRLSVRYLKSITARHSVSHTVRTVLYGLSKVYEGGIVDNSLSDVVVY